MNKEIRKSTVVYSILSIVVGLLLLIIPRQSLKAIIVIIGVALVASSIFSIIKVRVLLDDPLFKYTIITRSVLSIIVGILVILIPLVNPKAWQVMTYILAIYLVISALAEIFIVTKMRKNGLETKPYIAEILSSLIMAVILFIVPISVLGPIILRLIGAVIMLLGVAFLIVEFKSRPIVVYAEEVPNDPNETPIFDAQNVTAENVTDENKSEK